MTKRYNFYILSLFESPERCENVKKLKNKLLESGYNVEIIQAYYYKSQDVMTIMYQEGIEYTCEDRSVSLSQIGCFLSHRVAWKKIANANPDEVHIILEDDMELVSPIYDFNEMPEHDAVILWRHPSQMNTNVTRVKKGLLNYYNQWGLCAYAVTPQFAQELINKIKGLDAAADLLIYRDFFPSKKVFIVEENAFINNGFLGDYTFGPNKLKSWIYSC